MMNTANNFKLKIYFYFLYRYALRVMCYATKNMQTKKIIKFCEDYLKVNDFEDYCHNSLQVEGDSEIKKIITGVSLSEELIKKAITKKAQMIIVHHGIFAKHISSSFCLKGILKNRLKLLLENNINLAGFHLPLDAHGIIGNNISLAKKLGLKKTKPFDIGFIGELNQKIEFNDFVKLVNKKLNTKSYSISAGCKKIKKIGIIAGSYPGYELAKKLQADVYLTGEIKEEVFWEARELKINYIAAGHYNTEKLGIQNLGNLIAKKFKVTVEFVDIPCEV